MSLDAATPATRAAEGVKYRRACWRPRMKAAPRMDRALQELPPKVYRDRTWPLSASLLLEIRSAERPALQPGFGDPSAGPDLEHSLVEVLEASPRRLRVRFMGKLWVMEAAQSVSWISRDSVSGVILNGRVHREDVAVRLEAPLAVREPSSIL